MSFWYLIEKNLEENLDFSCKLKKFHANFVRQIKKAFIA